MSWLLLTQISPWSKFLSEILLIPYKGYKNNYQRTAPVLIDWTTKEELNSQSGGNQCRYGRKIFIWIFFFKEIINDIFFQIEENSIIELWFVYTLYNNFLLKVIFRYWEFLHHARHMNQKKSHKSLFQVHVILMISLIKYFSAGGLRRKNVAPG